MLKNVQSLATYGKVPKRETYFTVGFLNLNPQTWKSVHVFSFTLADFHCVDVSGPLKSVRIPRNVICYPKAMTNSFQILISKVCVQTVFFTQSIFYKSSKLCKILIFAVSPFSRNLNVSFIKTWMLSAAGLHAPHSVGRLVYRQPYVYQRQPYVSLTSTNVGSGAAATLRPASPTLFLNPQPGSTITSRRFLWRSTLW